jgi:hypothetical protein
VRRLSVVCGVKYVQERLQVVQQGGHVMVGIKGSVDRQQSGLTLLKLELLHSRFVRGDGGALDSDGVLLDSLGGIESDLVIGLVTVRQAQIVVLEVDIQVREDELVLDILPNDTGHLVTVELHDGVLDLDLGHVLHSLVEEGYGYGRSEGCWAQAGSVEGPCCSGKGRRPDRTGSGGVEGTHGGIYGG